MDFDIPHLFREVADLSPEQREHYFATHRVPSEVRDELERLLGFDKPGDGDTLGSLIGEAADLRGEAESLIFHYENPHPHPQIDRTAKLLLPAGNQIAHYVIETTLGIGGMGEVYRARDMRLGRVVALKVIGFRFDRPDHVARFHAEAQALVKLNHPHVVSLYDFGESAGRPFLVTELIEGETLRARLERGALPLAEALPIAVQVATALSAIHKAGIVHRDLKPENIMIRSDGFVKLLDFGVAKLLQAGTAAPLTETGMVIGTYRYMSPEQLCGAEVDGRSDLWSLGVVLCEMASGKVVSNGNDAPAGAPGSPPWAALVQKALQNEPAERFQSADEMLEGLQRLSQAGVPAGTLGTIRRVVADHALTASSKTERSTNAGGKPSIAVLPFVDMSEGQDQDWFSDGLAEEIINKLAQISGLKVIARTSAFAFRGKDQDVRGIAATLGVSTVLEGSVRRAGNRLRMTAQLINAEDGFHLWSQRYDREMTDIFAVQDEVAVAIAEALRVKLSTRPAQSREYSPKLAAYDALLKARHFVWQPSRESLEKAREFYEQAIAIDPAYSRAHSELRAYFSQLTILGFMPAHKAVPLSRAAVGKSMELDPIERPEALASLAAWTAGYDYDWKEAERLLAAARAYEPQPPVVRYLYAQAFLVPMARAPEAVLEMECALQEDPLNLWWRIVLAGNLWFSSRPADAVAELQRVLELDPRCHHAYFCMAGIRASQGSAAWKTRRAWKGIRLLAEAFSCAKKAYSLAPLAPLNIGMLAGFRMRLGQTGRAQELLAKLADSEACQVPFARAIYHLICAEIDEAADWVEKAIAQREPTIIVFLRSPLAGDLWSSPRWPAIAAIMNLPEVA